MFVLNSKIAIGRFRFTTVNEVLIRKSAHSVVETAEVHIPAIAMISKRGSAQPERRITSKLFKSGEAVVIQLGYNGKLQTEFAGYVKNVVCEEHVVIQCEGLSWLLKRGTPDGITESSDVQSAVVSIRKMLPGLHIKCKDNIRLSNVFSSGMSGLAVINAMGEYTDGNIQCFMAERDVLWCGRFYTACRKGEVFNSGSVVKYRIGFNALRGSALKVHNTEAAPVEVHYMKREINGTFTQGTARSIGDTGAKYERILNHVVGKESLRQLADEKMERFRYAGLEGRLTAFLQPYVQPGYRVLIEDILNPDRDGIYVAEGVEVRFGMGGGRRIIELGPKVGNT